MYSPFHLYLYRYNDLYISSPAAAAERCFISVTFYYIINSPKHHPLPAAFPGILVCFYNYQQDYQQGFSLTAASSDAFFFNSHILNMNRPIHTEPGRRKAGLGLFVCLLWLNSADKSRKFLYMSACTNF